MNVRQGNDELLADYLTRFNKKSLQVKGGTDQLIIAAFLNGMNLEKYYINLMKDPPTTISQLMAVVGKITQVVTVNCM